MPSMYTHLPYLSASETARFTLFPFSSFFFRSQYHVAPPAIIQRPLNLLEWCSRLRIAYTFSPNFLMAQICREVAASPYLAGSLDLSQMIAFISGGEAVPIKTAIEFADVLERYGAPRHSLRAGFGMSETGVSELDMASCGDTTFVDMSLF